GKRARRHLPGGVMIRGRYDDLGGRAEVTRAALAGGAHRLYEAAFVASDTYVAVDILDRLEKGFALIEVKASVRPRLHHVQDAAVQTWVARASGLEVTRVEIMHLDPECAHPDLDRLFVREDVTDAVTEMLPDITAALAAQKRVLEGPRPEVAIGP